MYGVYPLLAAGGPLLCSHKVTKGLVIRNASLPHKGLYPANRAEPRAAIILPYFVRINLTLQQKLAMPLQPHSPPSFCPLSPEAYLLTGRRNNKGSFYPSLRLRRQEGCPAKRRRGESSPTLILQALTSVPPAVPQIFRIFISTAARLSFQETSGLFC